MTITKNPNGYTISDVVQGVRESRFYIGYTKREAVSMWKSWVKHLTDKASTTNDRPVTA